MLNRYIYFLFSLWLTKPCQACESELEIEPGIFKKVMLPFPYKHLTMEECKNVKIVPSGLYAVFNRTDLHSAVVATNGLNIFIGLTNRATDKTLIVNYSNLSDLESFKQIILSEMGIQHSDQIKGIIYFNCHHDQVFLSDLKDSHKLAWSNYYGDDEIEAKRNMYENFRDVEILQKLGITFRHLWHNIDEITLLRIIKSSILEVFDIKNRQQIKAYKANFPEKGYKDFPFIFWGIHINSQLNISSYCFFHEKIMDYIIEKNNEFNFAHINKICSNQPEFRTFRMYQSYCNTTKKLSSEYEAKNANHDKQPLVRLPDL